MRPILVTAALGVLCALPASAQDDYDLATGLADRGWYDLAEELYASIETSAALPAEKKAEGAYGLTRIQGMRADSEQIPETRKNAYDKAIGSVNGFLKKYPNHPRKNEAYSDLGYLYQQKGKFLMTQGKALPGAAEDAERTFADSEKLFKELIASLGKKTRPDPELEKANPQEFQRLVREYDDWEQRMMFAKYNYGVSLFSHAEVYRETPAKHPEMKRLLQAMATFFEQDFMWDFENYLLAYDAFIYMGRGFQMLAETAEPGKADDLWKNCKLFVGKGTVLAENPDTRKNPAVREIVIRSYYHLVKAINAQAVTKSGQNAKSLYAEISGLAKRLFNIYADAAGDDLGKAIALEQGRALCRSDRMKEGQDILERLQKAHAGTWVEAVAADYLSEFAGEANATAHRDTARTRKERGGPLLFHAVAGYRKALAALQVKNDDKVARECWLELAQCYDDMNRFWEAASACGMLERPPHIGSPEGAKATMIKLDCLKRIRKITGQKSDEQAYTEFLAWANTNYAKEVGSSTKSEQARQLEKEARQAIDAKPPRYKDQYLQAAKIWAEIARDRNHPIYSEAEFSAAYDFYFHALMLGQTARTDDDKRKTREAYTQSLERFAAFLAWYERLQTKEKELSRYALGAIRFSCNILLNDYHNKPEAALQISQDLERRFPDGETASLLKVFAMRLEAQLDLGRFEQAEADLAALRKRFDKDPTGYDSLKRAITLMVKALDKAADAARQSSPAKADALAARSAELYAELVSTFGVTGGSPSDGALDRAATLVTAAETKMQEFQKTGNRTLEAEAKKLYDQALGLYKEYKASPSADPAVAATAQREATKCLLKLGRFDDAKKDLLEIVQNDPEGLKGAAREALADCLMVEARAMKPSSERTALIREADKYYTDVAAALQSSGARNEHYWRLLYRHAEALFECSYDELAVFFTQMDAKGYAPEWDGNGKGYKPQFEELRRKLQKVHPGGK